MALVLREVEQKHRSLLIDLCEHMNPSDPTYRHFIFYLETYIPKGILSGVQQTPIDVLALMEERGVLKAGKYQDLAKALEVSGYKNLLDRLKEGEELINRQMRKRRYSDGHIADGLSNDGTAGETSFVLEDISIRKTWQSVETELLEELAPLCILPYLTFLSENDSQAILCKSKRREMTKTLLAKVKEKLCHSFFVLLEALVKTGHEYLVSRLINIIQGTSDLKASGAHEPEEDFSSERFDVVVNPQVIKGNLLLQYGSLLEEIEALHLQETFISSGILDRSFFKELTDMPRRARAAQFLKKVFQKGSDALMALVQALKDSGREDLSRKLCCVEKRTPDLGDTDLVDDALVQINEEASQMHSDEALLWSCRLNLLIGKHEYDQENMKQELTWLSRFDKETPEALSSSSEAELQFDNSAKGTKVRFGDLDAECQESDTSVIILSKTVSLYREIVKQELRKLDKDIQEVQASSSETMDQLDNIAKETRDTFEDLGAKCQQTDTSVTIVSSGFGIVKQESSKPYWDVQEFKASSVEAMKTDDRISAENMELDISKLREDLIEAYRILRCVQMSPTFEKMRCDIDNIYVDLVIEEIQDSRSTKGQRQNVSKQNEIHQSLSKKRIEVTSYKQIFLDERGSKFKHVYLLGKGGLGKTTFCRKLLHAWCNAHKGRLVAQDGSFQDEATLQIFDLVFYVNLRDVSTEENLIEVICAQFPLVEVLSKNLLGTLLRLNGEKVLFILDGLDEMIVKAGFMDHVLTCSIYSECCFLVSSRPWKISQMELHEGSEIDRLLYLQGLSQRNAKKLAKNLFENCYNNGNAIKQFVKHIEYNKLAKQLIHVPLLLLFLAHVWYANERSLPNKLHELYILFFNLMAEKYKGDPNHRQMRFILGDSWSPFPIKISETFLVVNFGEGFLHALCEIAHHFLLSSNKENSLVFEETRLLKALGEREKEKLDLALDLGILLVSDSVSYLKRKTSVSFLHETMQEFFTAIYFIINPDKLANFISSIANLNDVQQHENIIIFLVGLMPKLGNGVLEKVNELCSDDWEMLKSGEGPDMYSSRLHDINKMYLRCKEEVLGEDVLLNVSGLYLQQNDFDLHCWNPAFLHSLILIGAPFTYDRLDLRGLTGLIYVSLHCINCELYLPVSGSLSVIIMKAVTLSSSCCDVLGMTLTHCPKLERLSIHHTDLHNCLLDLSDMTELRILVIDEVTLSSSCCDVLGMTLTHCPKLERLSIHHTDLHNCLLDLSNMTELRILVIDEVTLSSSCCDVLGMTLTHCPKLERLSIHHTDLHNCLLNLSNMTELTVLDMSKVTLSSSCCDILGSTLTHCTKLEKLSIHHADLHNCHLDLSNMTELKILDMSEVKLSSSCCDVLGRTLTNCRKLKTLKICNTHLHNCQLDLLNMTEVTERDMSGVTWSSSWDKIFGTHFTQLVTRFISHNRYFRSPKERYVGTFQIHRVLMVVALSLVILSMEDTIKMLLMILMMVILILIYYIWRWWHNYLKN